jgi:AraC-like DNA-binding protein
MSFSQWRVQARLRLAMSLLVDSVPVAVVGRRVGYQTTSAFVSAFRRLTGVTPGLYASNGLTDVSAVRSA